MALLPKGTKPMAVAANADDYTVGRVGIFFPANNQTPLDGNLTGQCVTLLKWFFAEMCAIPSPFSARGDARYVGKTLVAQGLAVEVPYSERRRGDVICYEYGQYGHIALQLSGGRVFEENVNIGGVARKLVDGAYVYASRIGNENESWRNSQHVYRVKSYVEGGIMANPIRGDVDNIIPEVWGRQPNPEDYGFINGSWHDFFYGVLGAEPWKARKRILDVLYPQAIVDRDNATSIAETRSNNLQRLCDALGVVRLPDEQATTQAIIDKFNAQVKALAGAEIENTKLQGTITDLQSKLDGYQNGDSIIITRKGFSGLFDVLKQFFNK